MLSGRNPREKTARFDWQAISRPRKIAESPVARNTLKLLRSALDAGGLKLTATANLSRTAVGKMLKIFEWPRALALVSGSEAKA
jgi:hypothetical protein